MKILFQACLNNGQRLNFRRPRARQTGISLMEIAVLMLIVTVALVPVVKNLGGPSNSDGNSARLVGMKSKELLLANTLIEKVLGNDFTGLNCGNPMAYTALPANGLISSFPTSGRCADSRYNQPLYYQWIIRNQVQAGSPMPVGNAYYTAVLNVYNTPTGGNPMLTLPTSFFYNVNGINTPKTQTGIVIVQDISGSMTSSSGDDPGTRSSVASPFLQYRYDDPSLGYVANASTRLGNLYDNTQLDIVSAQSADDPKTPWDDRFLNTGILGAPDCNSTGGPEWQKPGAFYVGPSIPNPLQRVVVDICNRAPNFLNDDMPRIEASRSSLLSFLVSLESDPILYTSTKLGFITFSDGGMYPPSGARLRVPMESVGASNQYVNMRRSISWMNRGGPGLIPASGGTWMYNAIQTAADNAFADSSLNSRIIFLVSDGEPNGPNTSHATFQALGKSIGNGTYPGSNGQKATIFTLGLVAPEADISPWMNDDLASQTPGGQFFYAQNVADIGPMFDQIKYQIQRVILLNRSNRYNINVS